MRYKNKKSDISTSRSELNKLYRLYIDDDKKLNDYIIYLIKKGKLLSSSSVTQLEKYLKSKNLSKSDIVIIKSIISDTINNYIITIW